MDFEEEEQKWDSFLELGRSLEPISLTEYLETREDKDRQLNMFIEGYRDGILVEMFSSLSKQDQITHIHLLELVMIYVRKKLGDMDKYQEMKDIVEKLKSITS